MLASVSTRMKLPEPEPAPPNASEPLATAAEPAMVRVSIFAALVALALTSGPPDAPAMLVPLTAVVRGPSGPDAYAVYVVENQGQSEVARLKEVQLGQVTGNEVAVTGGLAAGEQVIVTGATLVGDGKVVKVIP